MEKKDIPRKWTHFISVGKKIDGTKFLPFKVPLKDRTCRQLAPHHRFSPSILIKDHPNISLIIDVAKHNTYYNPYYNKQEFLTKGIDYIKIQCPAKLPPSDQIVQIFFDVVDKFNAMSKSEEALFGVHCINGVNRTGFLICKFMILRMGIKPLDAIIQFRKARGHGIQKKKYIEELLKTEPISFSPSAGLAIQSQKKPEDAIPVKNQVQKSISLDKKDIGNKDKDNKPKKNKVK